jgi:hypothetical protein
MATHANILTGKTQASRVRINQRTSPFVKVMDSWWQERQECIRWNKKFGLRLGAYAAAATVAAAAVAATTSMLT